MAIAVGQPAPDFTLLNNERSPVSLASFQGKRNVVLVFYVQAFTGGCRSELIAFRDGNAEFRDLNTQVLGVSVDTAMSLDVFAHSIDLNFPLLSDFPAHDVTRAYGTYDAARGMSRRVTYVIDKQGIIRAEIVSEQDMGRHAEEALRTVRQLEAIAAQP